MWTKIDDQFYMTLKNSRMDRDEQDLYLAGNVFCNGQLTDGFIPEIRLPLLAAWAKLPSEANLQAIASRLVEHEFWEKVDGGYMVHDFLDWAKSKEEVLSLKEARSQAGKRGGQLSQSKRQANAQANAQAKGEAKINPVPVPVPIVNSSRNGRNGKSSDPPNPDYQPMFEAVCQLTQLDPKLRAAAIGKTVKNLLAAGYTVESVTTLATWWRRNDFRGKQGQAPTLSQVEDTISKCKPMPAVPDRDDYDKDPATRAVREARKAAV